MAYYIGTQEFDDLNEATAFMNSNPLIADLGLSITSEPFGDPFNNFEDPGTYFPPDNNDRPIITDPQFIAFIEETLREEEYQKFIRDNFLRSDETEEDPRGPVPEVNIDEDVFQMILDSILGRANDIPPEILGDDDRFRNYLLEEQLPVIYQESVANAQEIADVLSSGDITSLEEMEAPNPLTLAVLEQGAMQFAGGPISTTTPPPTGAETAVITGGAGVTITTEAILNTGGRIFGTDVPSVDIDGNPILDADGNPQTEYRPGILDAMIPYIPGISLPNWMPTAGVIFLPTIGQAVNKLEEIIEDSDLSEAWEEGDITGVLSEIGGIIVDAGSSAADVIEEKIRAVIDQVTGAVTDPTKAGSVLGGIIGATFPSIPSWLPPLILDPRVYGSVRSVLTQNFNTPEDQFPPISEELETDPALMFTHRGNNYFVNKTEDEYFQLAESEDDSFAPELNELFTREQLENTGLETIGSGTYQSLLDDLSFHALEEDIYQYSLEDLRTRYEAEGGVIPNDWKETDEESRYNFFLADYFDIPTYIRDPDRGEGPTPDPDPDPDEDPDVTSVVEGLFADFLDQLDTEFTGQQDQINTIINNFVETLPDFDAMPTMDDIAQYFELNGVTLSEQNFDRIQEELANAGYLTQEQLTASLAGVATTEQVQEAIQGAGFATPAQVIQALSEAGYATPEDITTALANSGLATEESMLLALANAGYATSEQVEDIVNTAVAGIVIPEGATAEEVRQIIQSAIDGLPSSGEGLSVDDVRGIINEAIAGLDFPPNLSGDDVRNILDSFGFSTSSEVQAGFTNLNDRLADAFDGLSTQFTAQEAAFLESVTGLEASVIQELASIEGGLSSQLENLGLNIEQFQSDVSSSFEEFSQTFSTFQTDVQANFNDLTTRFNDAINGISTEFSEQEALFLESITGLESSLIQSLSAIEGGLSAELEMLDTNIITLQEAVAAGFDDFQSFTAEQFGLASDERRLLQQAIIAVDGNVTELSADFQRAFEEFGGNLNDLFEGVGFNIEALQQGQITQAEAFNSLNSYLAEQFETAGQERQNLQEAILNVGGDVNLLSDAMFDQFQAQNETIEELFAGTNVNIEALALGQISQSEAIQSFQEFVTDEFTTAQEDRIRIVEALINVNGQLEDLSLDTLGTFNELGLSIEELQTEFNVNFEALQQGQITQFEAYNQFQDDVTERLDISNAQLEDIITGQEDVLTGQEDILTGQQDIITGQMELEQDILAGNVLTALAAGGMFGGGAAAPARAPYEEFMKGITYRPREAPQLAIKTPAVDYNEEAQQLLMRTRRRGMLA